MASTGAASGLREESWNSFHVLYRYHVGDREYVAGGVEPYDFGMQNSAGAARMAERHPVGSSAAVAYDPADPARAFLEPGPSASPSRSAASARSWRWSVCGFVAKRQAVSAA